MPTRALRKSVDGIRGQNSVDETHRKREVWALKDATFQIRRGEVVGVIGRNGAGKSTLLKILTRITKPTSGRAEIRGRVGSLLEVGTGFHPELSGRENIFFNGVILGMRRQEIIQKFDEIVEFSGVEKFLDTPVKRYSSGMRVRLAFAVAAHLDPEILLVDEVLAVGDADFQRRCIVKMKEVSNSGRTILFVSHNISAIQSLCNRGIVFSDGKILADSSVENAIASYSAQTGTAATIDADLTNESRDSNSNCNALRGISIRSEGLDSLRLSSGEPARIAVDLNVPKLAIGARVGIGVSNRFGQRLFTLDNRQSSHEIEIPHGEQRVECFIPPLWLAPGEYFLTLAFSSSNGHRDYLLDKVVIRIHKSTSHQKKVSLPTVGDWVLPSRWVISNDKCSKV